MKNTRTMLIVDDSRIDRAILANIFKGEYDIAQASGGLEALKTMRERRIDLVILDILMDDIDGFKVIETMRADPALSRIPVVVTTSEPRHEQLALEAGADDFVAKPLDPVVVKKRVDNIVTKYMLERERLEEELHSKEEELQSLADSVPGGICVARVSHSAHSIVLEYFNDSFCDVAGLTRQEMQELYASHIRNLIYESDWMKFERLMSQAASSQVKQFEARLVHADGGIRWIRISAVKFRQTQAESIFRCVVLDITESKRNELLAVKRAQELRYNAEHDQLTGLLNRTTFFSSVAELVTQPNDEGYLLVQFDIERFKVLNELYGSARGDEVLRSIASALGSSIGRQGVSGRMSSDWFGFCIPNDEALLQRCMDEILRQCQQTCPNYVFRICYGGYVVDDLSLTVDAMCDRANLARSSIKGVYDATFAYYTEEMHRDMLEEQELLDEGERGLPVGQFEIWYQPIYDLATAKLASAEALVRWRHPEKGLIAPFKFIPVFESSGFIVRLDRYVRECVGQLIGLLNAQGVACPPISVNFSRLDLSDPQLVADVRELVERYGVDKSQFRIEVTESAFAQDEEQMSSLLDELRGLGFTLLMDDFGSGLSSLGMLRNIPVDVLKLDMRFLDDRMSEGRGRTVLSGVIPLAKALGLPVIAEGVETAHQVEFLRSVGCDFAQGYHYAKPMPQQEFLSLLMEGV